MELNTAHSLYYKVIVILYLLPVYTTLKQGAIQLPAITTSSDSNSHDCPPWGELQDNRCVCREKLSNYYSVKCDNETLQLSVIRCHCVTFDNETNQLFEGNCFENCDNDEKDQYLPLPKDINKLNQLMCEKRWNRTGRLCGKCLPGHSPLAYSFDMRCVKCPEGNKNVWKYILVAFGPLIVFFFLVIFLKINATSSYFHGYLIFSQVISAPVFARILFRYVQNHKKYTVPFVVFNALFSIWNLDFFRGFYPDICLDVSTLTVLALDYAVAIYPLLLTVVSYFMIKLHAKNFRIVVVLWRPFRFIFTRIRKNWNVSTTVIDAYTTFFVLSFVKITTVSIDLLLPVRAYSLNNDSVTWVLYYDGTVGYFDQRHLLYAIFAITSILLISTFVIFLLLLYPLACFQKLLSCMKVRSQLFLAVMDSFQGCYKNGTETGTTDCRWFSAVPFIGQLVMLLIYSIFLDSSAVPIEVTICIAVLVLLALIQPYKQDFHTKVDIVFWGLLAIFFAAYTCVVYGSLLKSIALSKTGQILIVAVAFTSLLYVTCLCSYWMLSRVKKMKTFVSQMKAWKRGYVSMEADFIAALPDRIAHPENYQQSNMEDLVNTY